MPDFIRFHKGVMKMPVQWRLWVMLLVFVNLVVPLLYLNRLEAQVVVVALFLSVIMMTLLTAYGGFTRLLGLGHVFWFPLIYFLWTRLAHIPTDDFFGIWVRALMMFNAAALAIDVIDVIRYIAGDREETVKGLS